MTVSTKKTAKGTSHGSTASASGAVQQSGGSLSDPLCDPLQASTGIFGGDAVQMDGVDIEDAAGGQGSPDVCRVPTAETGDQGGTMIDQGAPADVCTVPSTETGDQCGTMRDQSATADVCTVPSTETGGQCGTKPVKGASTPAEKEKIPKGF